MSDREETVHGTQRASLITSTEPQTTCQLAASLRNLAAHVVAKVDD